MDADRDILIRVIESDEDYTAAFTIRTEVFVEEEKVDSETEYDGFDHLATHYLATYGDVPAGASRWRSIPGSGRIKLERIAVLKEFRRKGIGTALAEAMLADIPTGSEAEIFIHVPLPHLSTFARMGFVEEGEPFEEAGMPHKKMLLDK